MRPDGQAHTPERRDLRIALWLFIGVTCLFVAISRGVFLYGDDILMYQVTRSIVEDGSVAVSSPHDRGDVARAIPGRDGQGYAKYGIGQSLVAVPSYVAADLVVDRALTLPRVRDAFGNQRLGPLVYGTALINAVVGGAVAAVAFLLGRALGYAVKTGLVLVLLLVTGTLLAHYSATFLSEPLSALCLLVVVYGLVMADGKGARLCVPTSGSANTAVPSPWLVLSGFAAGLTLATKLALGVALIPAGLWFLWLVWSRWRHSIRSAFLALLSWGMPVALWLAGIGLYNWYRFGDATSTGYGGETTDFSTPFLTGLAGLLISPGRGVFWYNPPLLLAVIGFVWLLRRRAAPALTIAGTGLALVLFYASYYQWYGGGAWGTRLLVPAIPLLLLPAGEFVERAWTSRWLTGAVVLVGLAGLTVTALGILVPFDTYVMEYSGSPAALDESIWNIADSPLVVHAERLDLTDLHPDIAPSRYNSPQLAVISAVAAVAGSLAFVHAAILGFARQSTT